MEKRTESARETIDRVMGLDSGKLQREMTEGLAEWCRKKEEEAHARRLYLTTLGAVLLLAIPAYSLSPVQDYRLDSRTNYEEVMTTTNNILGR